MIFILKCKVLDPMHDPMHEHKTQATKSNFNRTNVRTPVTTGTKPIPHEILVEDNCLNKVIKEHLWTHTFLLGYI